MSPDRLPTKKDSTAHAAVVDVLKRVEARHADPSKWCKNAEARGRTGRPVKLFGNAVVSTCLVAAIDLEGYMESSRVRRRIYDVVRAARDTLGYGKQALTSINDQLGYDAVRAVERRAIELAEADGAL